MKSGPERTLFDRYWDRLGKTGGQLGYSKPSLVEITESRASNSTTRKRDEAQKLEALTADMATPLILFDERGKSPSSRDFANWLETLRDAGRKQCVLAIGGPDGHDAALRDRATHSVSFGALTMPHQLVRVLVAEQLYRAMSISSGHPYHRD